jgi:hypothetical protein
VIYHIGEMAYDQMSIADARAAFRQWAAKTGAALTDLGEPVRSAVTVTRDGVSGRTFPGPFMGWSVIEATDSDEAARLMQDHPFIGRGGMLRIIEPV